MLAILCVFSPLCSAYGLAALLSVVVVFFFLEGRRGASSSFQVVAFFFRATADRAGLRRRGPTTAGG